MEYISKKGCSIWTVCPCYILHGHKASYFINTSLFNKICIFWIYLSAEVCVTQVFAQIVLVLPLETKSKLLIAFHYE